MSCGENGEQAFLDVTDNGPGIPAEDRERGFDRFYRRGGDGETGSGLGMAIGRRIAARQGATVAQTDSGAGGLRVLVAFPVTPLRS